MFKSLLIVLHIPLVEIRIKVLPEESAFAMRGIAEIVNLVASLTQGIDHLRIVLVSPAACYVDLCHF
jgi:hypothetical protein